MSTKLIEGELELEVLGSDPGAEARVRYVTDAFRFRDALGTFDPRIGGGVGGRQTIVMARNAALVTPGTFMRTADGMSTVFAQSPPVVPFNATIIAASIGVNVAPGGQWGGQIEVNGIVKATLTDNTGTATTIVDATLAVSVLAGDRIGGLIDPGGVTNVAFPVFFVILRDAG